MKLLLTPVFLFLSVALYAQISGTVINEINLPLAGATVKLCRKTDSAAVQTRQTDARGKFAFERMPDVFLRISFTGYAIRELFPPDGGNAGMIALAPVSNKLQGITLQSRRGLIEQLSDRSVININTTVQKLAHNALELLALAPGLQVSENEDAITLTGKEAVAVMINDKLVRLSARDLTKLLKSMPTGSVSRLEIMTSPSPKYDLPGNTALLLLKTHRNLVGAANGNLNFSTGQGGHNWGDLSGTVNYGTGKLAVNGYMAYHYGNYETWYTKEMKLPAGNLLQENTAIDRWRDPVARLTADYYLNTKHIFGALIESENSNNHGNYRTLSLLNGAQTITVGESPNVRRWNTYNLNYRFADTTGNELSVDLDRSGYRKNDQTVIESSGKSNWYHTLTDITISTAKADYTHRNSNKLTIESGIKLSHVRTDNHLTQNDALQNNLFNYTENVRAIYGNIGKRYDQWGWQAGLRVEYTQSTGVSVANAAPAVTRPDTSYLNLLPACYVTYTPSARHQFRVSINKGIKRPDYSDLQPFLYQVDPFNYTVGNPSLRVQRNTTVELSYTLYQKITVASSYTRSTDLFNPVLYQQGGTTYESTQNSGDLDAWVTNLNYPVKIAGWWNTINKGSISFEHYKGQLFEGYLDQQQWSWQASTTQRFTLSNSATLQLTGRYSSPNRNLVYYYGSNANISVSISKKMGNDKGSIRIGFTDLFNTQRRDVAVDFGNLRYAQYNRWESQRLTLDFTWKFGNSKIKQAQERESGMGEERSRSGK